MPAHVLLELSALALAYLIVVIRSYFQMRSNPLSKGPRLLIVLASGTLLLRGASTIVWDPFLAEFLYSTSRVAILTTGLCFASLIFLWRVDDQFRQ